MKYTQEIIIHKPIQEVVAKFDDPRNLKKWMKGLQRFEHLSGTPGQAGAKSKLIFKMGKRDFEMIETISVRNLPKEFTGTYEAGGVVNIVKNSFVEIGDKDTNYISENEFQFKGIMKVIAFIMPGAFKKQSFRYMVDFKNFVESED
jgi:hypothetical protein